MNEMGDLLGQDGVIAIGQYAYRGDRYTYRGKLSDEQARWLSIVCRATTMGMAMHTHLLRDAGSRLDLYPPRGWLLWGDGLALCVLANVFCLVDSREGSPARVLSQLRNWVVEPIDMF